MANETDGPDGPDVLDSILRAEMDAAMCKVATPRILVSTPERLRGWDSWLPSDPASRVEFFGLNRTRDEKTDPMKRVAVHVAIPLDCPGCDGLSVDEWGNHCVVCRATGLTRTYQRSGSRELRPGEGLPF